MAGGLKFADRCGHQFQHGREVVDSGAHVRQGLAEAAQQRLFAVCADRIEDHLDHRLAPRAAGQASHAGPVALDLDDRVEHGADRKALIGDFAHHAVDQEGGVVLHDLQSVQPGCGLSDPHLRRAPRAARGEPPEIRQLVRQFRGGKLRQFVSDRVLRRLGCEYLDRSRAGVAREFGFQDFCQPWTGARCAGHALISHPKTRTPPEERFRRRVASPWGSGEALCARCVRGVGGRTQGPNASGVRFSIGRKRIATFEVPPVIFVSAGPVRLETSVRRPPERAPGSGQDRRSTTAGSPPSASRRTEPAPPS